MTVHTEDLGTLPPAAAEQVRRKLASLGSPDAVSVPVRDAATVLLLRDAPAGGVEVLLQRRTAGLAFAGGMTVFPGGVVDPSDEVPAPWDGAGPDPGRLFATAGLARAILVAAVRETFEEVGVLIPSRDPIPDAAQWRGRLERREVGMSEVLATHGLRLSAEALVPWAAWVTPEGEARRYDTRFLAARMPDGQHVTTQTVLATEAVSAGWARPADALAALGRGEVAMLPPTRHTLEGLLTATDADDAIARARSAQVRRYEPTFVVDNGTGAVRVVVRVESAGVADGQAGVDP